jgi:hypothetical protein
MNFSRVPPASFEDAESVTAFIQHFEESEPSRILNKLAYPIMSVLLPRVAYDLGAREAIEEHRENDGQIYLLLDHTEGVDIPVHAATVYRSHVLRSLKDHVDIESKPANLSKSLVAILLRELGADGVIRGEDLDNERFNAPPHLRKELMALAMELQVPISVKNIDAGHDHATYWTGGRRGKKGRPLERLKPDDVKEGVLQTLERIADPERVRLVFVGSNYDNALFRMFGANAAISRPYEIPATRDEKKELIAGETQKCVDAAAWMSRTIPPGPLVGLLKNLVERPA